MMAIFDRTMACLMKCVSSHPNAKARMTLIKKTKAEARRVRNPMFVDTLS